MPRYAKRTNRKPRRGIKRRRTAKKRNYRKQAARASVLACRTELVFDSEVVGVSQFTTHGQAYSLSQMPSYTNMSLLYDQYRLVQVKEEFTLQSDMQTLGASAAIPLFFHIVDHDDNIPVATLQRIMNEPRAVIKPFKGSRSITFRPRLDADVGNISSAGVVEKSMWCDTEDPTAAHYGLKWGLIGDGAYTYPYKFMRRTTWTVEFRHPKSI